MLPIQNTTISIHDTSTCINNDDKKALTPSESYTSNNNNSTSHQGVPIITDTTLYTTYPSNHIIITGNNVSTHTYRLHNMKFYYRFYGENGFEHNEPVANKDIYIAIDNPHGSNDRSKSYSLIRDRYNFLINYLNIPEQSRNFYEVILGHQAQKPYFDLDVDLTTISTYGYSQQEIIDSTEDVLNCLFDCISEILLEHNIPYNRLNDLLVFPSHGPNKRSYHIVVDGYCHLNNKEAKAFYDLVIDRIASKITYNTDVIVLDSKVYSGLQCFRMFGSTKLGKNRLKRFDRSLSRTRDPTIYTDLDNFYSYMLTAVEGCIYLPSFIKEEERYEHQTRPINGYESDEIMVIFNNYRFPLYTNRENSTMLALTNYYKYQDSNGSSIRYMRINPGYCPCHPKNIKHEEHQSVGCYITVSIGGYVKFHCYSENPTSAPVIIGRLNTIVNIDDNSQVSINKIQSNWLETKGIHINNDASPSEEVQEEITDAIFNAGDYNVTWDKDGTIIKHDNIIQPINSRQQAQPIINGRQQAQPIVNDKQLVNNTTIPVNTTIVNQPQFKATYRVGTDADFINFCRSMYCTDPSQHTLSECYTTYSIYCRNNYIIPQPVPAKVPKNKVLIDSTKVNAKRQATIDDITTFVDTLRINDNKARVACKELYEPFRQYCNENNLIPNNGVRAFTNVILNSKKILTTIVNNKYFIGGISIRKGEYNDIDLQTKKKSNISTIISKSNIYNIDNRTNITNDDKFPLLGAMSMDNKDKDNKPVEAAPTRNNNIITFTNRINASVHSCPLNNSDINNNTFESSSDKVISFHPLNQSDQENIINETPIITPLPTIEPPEKRLSTTDDIDSFIRGEFIIDTNEKIPSEIVYEAFTRYCELHNLKPSITCGKLFNSRQT